jgi:hypothetical protein
MNTPKPSADFALNFQSGLSHRRANDHIQFSMQISTHQDFSYRDAEFIGEFCAGWDSLGFRIRVVVSRPLYFVVANWAMANTLFLSGKFARELDSMIKLLRTRNRDSVTSSREWCAGTDVRRTDGNGTCMGSLPGETPPVGRQDFSRPVRNSNSDRAG